MFHGVLMNVIEPGEIGTLKGDMAIPILKPHFSRRCIVPHIHLPGCLHVKFAEEFPELLGLRRRRCDKVVVICQDCPSAQVPGKFRGASKQRFEKKSSRIDEFRYGSFL